MAAALGGNRSAAVTLPGKVKAWFALNRWSCCRGLRHLEEAGLVRVKRRGRHSPTVVILDITEYADG
jgi:hypothetical protein